MGRQNPRVRYILSMVVAQTVCAGVALWIFYQMVLSSIVKGASEEIARDLSLSLLGDAACTLLWMSVLMTVVAYLFVSEIYERFARTQRIAETESLKQVQSLMHAQDAIIVGLAKLTESRDDDTGRHLERISVYACRLAAAASCHPKFRNQITGEFIDLLRISAPMHDIGKVGIQDKVLLKPGRLTASERVEIEQHTTIGGNCLMEIEQRLENSNFLQMAREIVLSHHERWDGTGYPAGLVGEAIPLAARITSIADVYDALMSDRVYRDGYDHEQCVEMIQREAGMQFDPDLVDVFVSIQRSFREIANLYGGGWDQAVKPSRMPVNRGEEPSVEPSEAVGVIP